jgi:hypothetical protein
LALLPELHVAVDSFADTYSVIAIREVIGVVASWLFAGVASFGKLIGLNLKPKTSED